LLNFGHTIGHGIEAAAGYGTLLHGEAISLGLLAACKLSIVESRSACGRRRKNLFCACVIQTPMCLDASISTDAIFSALKKDKKFAAGSIRFVLLRRLGDAFVSDAVSESDIRQAIDGLR
jgi:3-dehydroquinate synthetase